MLNAKYNEMQAYMLDASIKACEKKLKDKKKEDYYRGVLKGLQMAQKKLQELMADDQI